MARTYSRLFFLILFCFFLTACSDANIDAPPAGQVHEQTFMVFHGDQAKADLNNCKSCHGGDLSGGTYAVSCLTCHPNGEPITIHPLPYSDPWDHGVAARNDQSGCLPCHGTAPNRFDGGILSDPDLYHSTAGNCSASGCHSDAHAHPTRWQGSNDNTPDYQASHRVVTQNAIDDSCARCHQVTVNGPQPRNDAPSCFAVTFTNTDGSTTGCHAGGPGTVPHEIPFESAGLHGESAKADLAVCQSCHGTPGTIRFDGGTADTSCTACHTDAGAHPTRWQGSNDNTDDYGSSHRNAGRRSTACIICHDVTQGRTAPNPAAPSCFSATFTNADGSTTGCHANGPVAAPHPLPYTDPLDHGVDAKNNLVSCVSCHATPSDAGAGDNPRFNVSIGSMVNGCEDCHAANTAHPTSLWTGAAAGSHKTAKQMDVACALCHGTNLNGPPEGGVGPACTDCHTAGSPLTLTDCSSCHNRPPDGGAPAGNQYPNRNGAHTVHNALPGMDGNCNACHQNAGTETAVHFNGGISAIVSLSSAYDAQSGSAWYTSGSQTCGTTRCHGGQTTPNWYSGSLDVDTACTMCHSTRSGQYNSATSGRHRKHVTDENLACTDCHDTSLLAADHFDNLSTASFEGNPADTLNAYLNYNPATGRGCSVSGCHRVEDWNDDD